MLDIYGNMKLDIYTKHHNGEITEDRKNELLTALESVMNVMEGSAQDHYYKNKDKEFDSNTKKKEIAERMLINGKMSDDKKKKVAKTHGEYVDRIITHHEKNPYRKYMAKGVELPEKYTETKKGLEKSVNAGRKAALEKEVNRQEREKKLTSKNPFTRRKAKSFKASQEFLDRYYKDDDIISKGSDALDILKAEKEDFKRRTSGKSYVDEKMAVKIAKDNASISSAKKGKKRGIFSSLKKYVESCDEYVDTFSLYVYESYEKGTLSEESVEIIFESPSDDYIGKLENQVDNLKEKLKNLMENLKKPNLSEDMKEKLNTQIEKLKSDITHNQQWLLTVSGY